MAKLLSRSPPSGGEISTCRALAKSVRVSGTTIERLSGELLS